MKKFYACLLVGYFAVVLAKPVEAYLDPGSTSMIWQLVLSVLAGAAIFLKIFWNKFANLFRSEKKKELHSEHSEESS